VTPVVTPSDLSDGELILAAQGFWAVSEGFAIQSARQYALALEVLGVAKLAWKVLEERRVTITGPLDQALAIYRDCEAVLEKKMTAWRRRNACVTDGNCSSSGSGNSCGGYDCDTIDTCW